LVERFLWAKLQFEVLRSLGTSKRSLIEKALSEMPKTLDETYIRILENIPDAAQDVAFTLLRWIAYSERPLSLSELVDTTIITLDGDLDGTVDCEDRGQWDDALDLLAGLIVANQPGKLVSRQPRTDQDMPQQSQVHEYDLSQPREDFVVSLVHFSLQEYLESSRIQTSSVKIYGLHPERDHGYLAQSCLVYIKYNLEVVGIYSDSDHSDNSDPDYSEDSIANDGDDLGLDHDGDSSLNCSDDSDSINSDDWRSCMYNLPLLQYTLESWPYHSKRQKQDTCNREIALLTSEEYLGQLHELYLVGDIDWVHARSDGAPYALQVAAFFGLVNTIERLFAADENLHKYWYVVKKVCEIPFIYGLVDVFKVLHNYCAGRMEWVSEAVYQAVSEGYAEILKSVLHENLANPLCQADYQKAMVESTCFRHTSKSTIKILSAAGATMDARTGHPVHKILNDVLLADAESLEMHLREVVEPRKHENAFRQAADKCDVTIMELLLAHNIGYESIPNILSTACICPTQEDKRKPLKLQQENIQFLLERGAVDYLRGIEGLIFGIGRCGETDSEEGIQMLTWFHHHCVHDFGHAATSMLKTG
jgi:hypothetical protein